MDANIRLGWRCPTVTNALSYNTAVLITAVKGFIVQAVQIKGAINCAWPML